ncbi:MAG TPA: sodium:solute symporter [Candidatus Faeciplasma pullistercoris]|uniref:Sodium:solute symporter n=1 Tax=Candidatus Faeciplasma pullistercoris TaxID=2840800 RepID=A0A9D1KJU3_9FIRM|nr:sodium:solute symporter [Candidatus Faeciplasma pullistercoris]
MIITLCMIVCFFALMIYIGIRSRKHASDINGFVLGSRSVGPWLSAFAFGTSYFSAVIFVGYAGQFGWNFGLASTWIGLGNAFIGSLLAWSVLGRRTRIMTQHLSSKTMPDFFGARFESKGLKIAASVITFVFLIPYTASLYNGLSRLFSMAFDGIDYSVCVIVMAVLTGIYVIVGGYMATAINDFIQGIIMLVGIVAVILAVLRDNGGLAAATEELATGENGGWEYASFLGADPVFLLFVVILTSLGTWGLPQMVGKFYAIKNEESIKMGTVISTLFAIVVAGGCYFLGGFGRLYEVDVASEGYDAIIPRMLSGLSPVLIGIVIVLVLSASMSTLSSLVLTSGSTVTLDFIAPMFKRELGEKTKMTIMRLFIVAFIVVSSVIAIVQASSKNLFIAQMMGVSWGALAGAFLAPFLYGLYYKKTTKAAVLTCFVYGVGLEIFQLFVSVGWVDISEVPVINFIFTNSLYSGVFAMVGGLIILPVVSLLTQKTCPREVEKMFSCYSLTKTVEITDSLGK